MHLQILCIPKTFKIYFRIVTKNPPQGSLKLKPVLICIKILADLDKNEWTNEEVQMIFLYYKVYNTKWSTFAKNFIGRTEGSIKNKFYSTLKKVATQAQLEAPARFGPSFIKCKKNLLQFVDVAIVYGQSLSSKRGRKRNIDRERAPQNAILFPIRNSTSESLHSLPPLPASFFDSVMNRNLKSKEIGFPNNGIDQLKIEEDKETSSTIEQHLKNNTDRMQAYDKWLSDVLIRKRDEKELPYPINFKPINT